MLVSLSFNSVTVADVHWAWVVYLRVECRVGNIRCSGVRKFSRIRLDWARNRCDIVLANSGVPFTSVWVVRCTRAFYTSRRVLYLVRSFWDLCLIWTCWEFCSVNSLSFQVWRDLWSFHAWCEILSISYGDTFVIVLNHNRRFQFIDI